MNRSTLSGFRAAHQIDRWLATGPAAYTARDFLLWTAEQQHSPQLHVPSTAARAGTALDAETRWALLARLLNDPTIELTDRVAGSLLLCYAQPLSRITALTLDHVTRTATVTTIRFGAHDIVVPEPLAGLIAEHTATPRPYLGVGTPAASRWLFPGGRPGRPLTAARLGVRLARLGINARAARHAALLHLAAEVPAAVLAQMLNLSPDTATRWTAHAGGTWNRYAATLATEHDHQHDE